MPEPTKSSPPAEGVSADSQGPQDNTVSRANHRDPPLPGAHATEVQFARPQYTGELGTFGRYRVLKKLGQGGMGAVYLGYDGALERKVAIKVMLPQYAANAEARERFLREARSAAKVNSDHVVTIFDVGEQDGIPFIAMEYLLGYSLDRYLRDKGELPLHQVLRVCRETALGLAAAHALGMVHRDIKPGNLWLEAPKGRVKLLDFGLARPIDGDIHLTGSGAVVGTPAYMSPEQGRGQKVDHRSDLFSLGVMLYRLSTGTMPFGGINPVALLMNLAVDTPIPIRQVNPQLPEALEAVVTKLLAKNPAERYQSAKEVADALRDIERPKTSGPLPVVVPVQAEPMVVGAQTQNVWKHIDDSESVPVPLATPTARKEQLPSAPAPAPALVVKPTREQTARNMPKWPAILAGTVLLVGVAILVAVMWPEKKPGTVQKIEPDPQTPPGDPPPPPPPPSTVYPLPDDLLKATPPVKPKELFTLDHLDPTKIPPQEKPDWLPTDTVAVLGSHRQRVPSMVTFLAVNPTSDKVFAGHVSTNTVFDLATGMPVKCPPFECFSPNRKRAAAWYTVWDLTDPKTQPTTYPDIGNIVAFLTDDLVLAASGSGYTVWNLTTSKPLGQPYSVANDFAVSHKRKQLAIVFQNDPLCHIYQIDATRPPIEIAKLEIVKLGSKDEPLWAGNGIRNRMSLSDAGLLALIDKEQKVKIWDIAADPPRLRYKDVAPGQLWERVQFLPKSNRLVCVNQLFMQVWDVDGQKPVGTLITIVNRVGDNCSSLATALDGNPITTGNLNPFALDGATIVTGHYNGAVHIWSVENGNVFERPPVLRSQWVVGHTSDISPDGQFAALCAERDGFSRFLWNLKELKPEPLPTSGGNTRFSPDGNTVATSLQGKLRILSTAAPDGKALFECEGVGPVCYSPDGKWLLTIANNEFVIWDVLTLPPKELPTRVQVNVNMWLFTPDSRFLVGVNTQAGPDHGKVKVYAMTPRGPVLRQEVVIPPISSNSASHFALSPDGKSAIFCRHNGIPASLYGLKEGLLETPRQLPLGPAWAEYSPDGRTLLVGGGNLGGATGLKLLDAATGNELRSWTLRGQPTAGRFHPDGKHIFVTNADRTTYILRLNFNTDPPR